MANKTPRQPKAKSPPKIKPPKCACGKPAELVGGDVIYPHRPDLRAKLFWRCSPCGAYVGTHKDSKRHVPLGLLADAEHRQAKSKAHAAFDPVWRNNLMSRSEAYRWLAIQLGIPAPDCHIGWMDKDTCLRVVKICKSTAWTELG